MGADFWYGLMVAAPFMLAAIPLAPRGFRSWRDERALLKGRKGAPGIAPVPPLGERLSKAETTLVEVKATVDGHTAQLKTLGDDVTLIRTELSQNGGNSLRDKVDELVAASKKPRRTRARVES